MSDPTWKTLEKDVHALHAQFASQGSEVKHDVKITGFESKVARQIDVAINTTVSDYPIFIAIECKNKKRPIDVEEISGFAGKVKDVQANRGVMISTSGYTPAAVNVARACGIDTLTYGETSNIQIGGLRTFLVTNTRKEVQWRVAGLLLDNEVRKDQIVLNHHSVIYRLDESRIGTISSQVEQRMTDGLVPTAPGKHLVDFGAVLLAIGKDLRPALVQVEVDIVARYFLGTFPFTQTKITDVRTGDIVRNLIRTPHISIRPWENSQPEWTEVDSLESLAITPSIQFMDGPAWSFK